MDCEFKVPLQCSSILGHKRTIVHIDIDCFYAQVEMLMCPELRTKPLGIQQKNIVVTCNYVAREYGVTKLMSLKEAKKICPKLVLVSGEDLTQYRSMSAKVTELLQTQFSPRVERLGLDENFVDVTELVESKGSVLGVEGHIYDDTNASGCECGCSERLSVGSHIAAEMRQELLDAFGLTTCAGISYNKLLAKLAGATHKPNQQTTVFNAKVPDLISSLRTVREIPGIGRQTAEILKTKLNIVSIEELQRFSLHELQTAIGSIEQAMMIQKLSFGIDDNEVKSSGKPQSLGIEDAFKEISSLEGAQQRLSTLLQRLLSLIVQQQDSRIPRTLRITVRKYDPTSRESRRESRQCGLPTLPEGNELLECSTKIMPIVMELFNKMVAPGSEPFHLTLLGVNVSNFTEPKKGKASILSFLEPSCKKPRSQDKTDEEAIAPKKSQTPTSQEASSKTLQASTSKDAVSTIPALPPNVDPEVFYQLPPSFQQEILDEWSRKRRSILAASPSKPKNRASNSIERYLVNNK